ncbi:hypothetical protein SO802_028374 [Lithocarpus litseifolius]|uniref:Uncharacterized protein n=1 Tax=Lithocarpus litseifolius TaxID=425828 RepID=A0AAW2BTA3_9ROSI
MSSRERKIDASNVRVIDIFPQLSALDAFKDERPDAIDRQKLTNVIPSLRREQEWTIEQLLRIKAAEEFIVWEIDVTTGKVLYFGYFYRKIFRGVGKILYSFHKKGEFSGNVINRMRVSQNLKVNHLYDGVKSPSDFAAGKKSRYSALPLASGQGCEEVFSY